MNTNTVEKVPEFEFKTMDTVEHRSSSLLTGICEYIYPRSRLTLEKKSFKFLKR